MANNATETSIVQHQKGIGQTGGFDQDVTCMQPIYINLHHQAWLLSRAQQIRPLLRSALLHLL